MTSWKIALRLGEPRCGYPQHGCSRDQHWPLPLRSDRLPADDELRIVTLGASTTECALLDSRQGGLLFWSRSLAASVGPVWVGNGGSSGTRVRHNVLQLEAIGATLPGVDVVTVLAGANDMLRSLQPDSGTVDWSEMASSRIQVHYEAFALPPGRSLRRSCRSCERSAVSPSRGGP